MTKFSAKPDETLIDFLRRQGIGDKACHRDWFSRGDVLIDGCPASKDMPATTDAKLSIRGKQYEVLSSNEPGRATLKPTSQDKSQLIKGKVRVHCGYHKCLTIYFKRVSKKTAFLHNPFNGHYRHFFHRVDEFYQECDQYNLNSISGHCLDLERFEDIRAVHIIRDPRDLIVSGYFYHKRSAEPWCDYINPTDQDWEIVNAPVPPTLPGDTSFADYLNTVSVEEGLAAEIEFRKHHLDSMLSWPTDDKRVLTVKYEDIIGNEVDTFKRIYDFYNMPFHTKLAAKIFANRYSLKSRKRKTSHIRNSQQGQWHELFPPKLAAEFNERYTSLLEKYDY